VAGAWKDSRIVPNQGAGVKMLDGLFLLLSLSVVMALASFLAGALPLSMTLSSSQLRLISTIGMGVLVGTSLIVIIPEGIEAVYSSAQLGHLHTRRTAQLHRSMEVRWFGTGIHTHLRREGNQELAEEATSALPGAVIPEGIPAPVKDLAVTPALTTSIPAEETSPSREPISMAPSKAAEELEEHHDGPPTFYIGLSLILGFILMYLIDKLPRHASEKLTPTPPTRHISLSNLSHELSSPDEDPESESFLHSLAPTPKQSRSLATTTGLVIHAAADGIAMGASASSPTNTKLGFIIFFAIMIHKAPAAFGLTSVLLKQGLSKRAARGHLIIFSLAAPVGALVTWILVHLLGAGGMEGERGMWWTGILLLFSAGTFLYVAMHAMQEDSHQDHSYSGSNGYTDGAPQRKPPKPQMRDTLAAVGGMLIPLLTQIGHHH